MEVIFLYLKKNLFFFKIFKMKFIGSDMYDENIYYFCLIIFIKVG